MRAPPSPSHNSSQRVQKEPREESGRGRAGRARGGPSLELVFRDSPRSVATRAKQPQSCYRIPITQPFLPDFRDLVLYFHGLR